VVVTIGEPFPPCWAHHATVGRGGFVALILIAVRSPLCPAGQPAPTAADSYVLDSAIFGQRLRTDLVSKETAALDPFMDRDGRLVLRCRIEVVAVDEVSDVVLPKLDLMSFDGVAPEDVHEDGGPGPPRSARGVEGPARSRKRK
jgi:hypothetical protein